MYERKLPPVPEGLTLEDLGLGNTAYYSLRRFGIKTSDDLRNCTIGKVLSITGFGAKSLLDLLTSLESAESRGRSPSRLLPGSDYRIAVTRPLGTVGPIVQPTPQLNRKLTRQAQRMRRRPYSRLIRRDDPRLGNLIRALIGILSSRDPRLSGKKVTLFDIADYLARRSRDPAEPTSVVNLLRRIDREVNTLCQMRLEDELWAIAVGTADERRAHIVCKLFGWDGRGGCTLQAVGDEVGLTRERIRQIRKKITDTLVRRKVFAPTLDRCLRIASKHFPDPAEIASQFARQGLTRCEFRLEGIAKACELLRRCTKFSVDIMAAISTRIGSAGRKAAEHWGVASVSDITNRVARETSQEVSADLTRRIMQAQPGFQWLDESTGWFWLSNSRRNRLINQIAKILSVARRVTVSELREGVSRHYRTKGFAPPRRVLLELCRQIQGYRVEGETVSTEVPIEFGKALAKTERTMAQVLRDHGHVMRRSDFEGMCIGLGMNRTTFYIYLDNSPIITKYAPGVYGLRGSSVTPAEIQALISERKHQKVMIDSGWTLDGKIWIAAKLSRATLTTGVLGIPAGMKRFVQGQFTLRADDAMTVGTLGARGGSAWGLGPFFAQRGGEPGDYLTIAFDLKARIAVVRIGDESILDRFRRGEEAPGNEDIAMA